MELVNELYAVEESVARAPSPAEIIPASLWSEVQRDLVLLLAPFAPHLANELWEMLGEKGSLLRVPWPKYDPALAKEDEIEIPVQINGKLRGLIVVPAGSADDTIRECALSDDKIKAAVAGKRSGQGDCGAGQACQHRSALSGESSTSRRIHPGCAILSLACNSARPHSKAFAPSFAHRRSDSRKSSGDGASVRRLSCYSCFRFSNISTPCPSPIVICFCCEPASPS